MKKLFVYVIGFLVSHVPLSHKIKDFLMWPIATRVLGINYRQKVFLKDGFWMIGSMQDILSRQILFYGKWKKNIWEPKTSKLLEDVSKGLKQIIIAGTHLGYLVLKAALYTKGTIHTFEPIPELFALSKENFSLNKELEKKIILNNEALGERNGVIELYVEGIRSSAIPYSGGHVQHKNIMNVPVTTLDTYTERRQIQGVDLLLLDVEGFEWFVLNGSENILKNKPKLILEISPKILSHTKITSKMMEERIRDLGYNTQILDQDQDYANIYATIA